ncbi:hypothetical protein HanPSC8_Chr08g0329071 [Helianthus annuus]|nr:hypothetical protein HanIR_Chr08g0367931 [Helianthus annuus]KAJ0901763.1 hypothetical protein HanPSC8_Chr08g0329071 [Helianthus annuus]
MIDGSPTDFEETNRISHSPPLEHNSDEEDAMSVYLLGETETEKAFTCKLPYSMKL